MENKTDLYFTTDALQKMLAVHGKTVENIIIYLWQNLTDPNNSVEIIDSLQLTFSDKSSITIGCNENSEGLDILNFNYQELKSQLEQEFQNKIKIHALNAGKTKMWTDIIGKTLESIQLTKQGDYYLADSLLLNFGEEKRTVALNPLDGLIIDYFEDI
jgi:hypothetical protein